MSKVLVMMSGGVDSSVAAALLRAEGHDVTGVTLKLWGGESDSGCCSASDVEDANEIALRRAFSWTRFLSRLEKTLPPDIRIASIGLQKLTISGKPAVPRRGSGETILVSLVLISRDPNGLPKTIRAFDGSPWFEAPMPSSEDRGEKGLPEGRRLALSVSYRDVEARKDVRP